MDFKFFVVSTLLGARIISESYAQSEESSVLSISESYARSEESRNMKEEITIIGAGLGGTYTAYKLKDKNLKIGLYEMSNRIGGRFFTRRLRRIPDISIELCAMRFVPEDHIRLMKIVRELNLPIADFEQKLGVPSKSHYYVRGQHIPFTKIGKPGYLPFRVKPSERFPPDELKYNFFKAITNTTDNSEPLYTLATKDGIPLYIQSHRQVLGKIASNEAYQYLKETSSFYAFFEDTIGLLARSDKPKDKTVGCPECDLPEVKKIVTGFQSVPETLLKKFLRESSRHKYHSNDRLIKISKRYGGKVKLTFQRTVTENGVTYATNKFKTITTGKVIITLPREQLLLVDWKPLQDQGMRTKLFDSVYPIKTAKIFLGYQNPWWKRTGANFTYAITDLTIGQLYHWDVSTSGQGILLASYTDRNIDIWKRLQGQGRVVGGSRNHVVDVTEEVVKQVHRDLAELYEVDVNSIPKPIDGAMHVFDDYPNLAALHFSTPGYKLEEIRPSTYKPSCRENVFIASGSYASLDFQGWAEGTLQVQEEVLNALFENGKVLPCKVF